MSHTQHSALGTQHSRSVLDTPAKLNLSLAVGPRRPDGYHDVDGVLVPIDWCDTLALGPIGDRSAPAGAASPAPGLRVEGPERAGVPLDASNLVLRAWASCSGRGSRPAPGSSPGHAPSGAEGFTVHGRTTDHEPSHTQHSALDGPPPCFRLHKRIPVAAGLGGGSSDAAAALRLLARDGAPLPWSEREWVARAAALGADVPFFLDPQPARAAGRGERLTPVTLAWEPYFVVCVPDCALSTAAVYARFDELADETRGGDATGEGIADRGFPEASGLGLQASGSRPRALGSKPEAWSLKPLHPPPSALRIPPAPVDPAAPAANDLEAAARSLAPALDALFHAAARAGAPRPRLSGSGPAVFWVLAAESEARAFLAGAQAAGRAGPGARWRCCRVWRAGGQPGLPVGRRGDDASS